MTNVGEVDGLTLFPADAGYQAAVEVFNLAAPVRPAAAVTARTVGQVRAAVLDARRRGWPVRVHSTGHGSAAARPVDGGLLIRTRIAGEVRIDPATGVARIPAGTRWGEVARAAAAHGLAAPHGSSPTVGAVGYLLRGGVSSYGRQVGLAANSVRAVELVTADGEFRRVDVDHDPELFRALRGGGGGFGVVTAVELALFPVAAVVTGAAFWSADHAAGLLAAWRRWTRDAPHRATTSLRVMNLPAIDGVIPPALSAGPVVCVDGAVLAGTDDDLPAARRAADDLLGPLRAVAPPIQDSWATGGPLAVLEAHLDPADPVPLVGDHLLLRELDEAGEAAFLTAVGPGSGSPLINAELRQLGGALAVPGPGGGVLDHLPARYAYVSGGMPFGPVTAADIRRHCASVRRALTPWDTGRTAPTFVETVDQPQGHLDAAGVAAVDRVRARVDPDGLFRHDVAPHTSALR
ncbi:FAD-dependent oxidoreductase [Micromonospora sp. R77]|uniref:FAD-binding oxidoreductase n=1 Tax=Micromonospora sp. R77 TaxID=2925836 RepID=UPI001F60F381|nr:FAD-dependent oxidoreductase [Micromonospora sp. R77]MCI4061235.1 FAD-dependent oxidoreductase [Micromonospora sp. R77]